MFHGGGLSKNKNATKVLSKKIFIAISAKNCWPRITQIARIRDFCHTCPSGQAGIAQISTDRSSLSASTRTNYSKTIRGISVIRGKIFTGSG
jgi:hypothetical protein